MFRIKKISFPFFILFIIHSILLISTLVKKKENRKPLFMLLLTNIGFAYILEFFVLNLYKSYKYKPKIMKNRYLDNVFGGFLSQAIFLPFTAIFISAYELNGWTKIAFAIYFSMIEKIFIKLGIFKNYWWKTLYTLILIPLYFGLSDVWYKSLLKGNRFVLFITNFMMTWVTGVSITNIYAVLRNHRFGAGRFYTWRDHFILSTIYWFVFSVSVTFILRRKNGWSGSVYSFLVIKLVDWFIKKKGFVKSNLQTLLVVNSVQILMIFLTSRFKFMVYEKTISKSNK